MIDFARELRADPRHFDLRKVDPSWRGGLKKGDAILRVAQGAAEPVSIEGWHTAKAVTLIRGKKGTEVRLTVKKPDGSTKQGIAEPKNGYCFHNSSHGCTNNLYHQD